MRQSTYTFYYIERCEMCGDSTAAHHVLGNRLNQTQGISPKSKTGISVTVVKCDNCKLIYSQPLPIPQTIQDHYNTPPESYWGEDYFNVDENYFSNEINIVRDLLSFTPGMISLDIGAGLGKCMLAMEKVGFNSYGIEPSILFYNRAISKMGISKEKLQMGMVENVTYPENKFDFITYGAVFEHLYHPAESLEKSLAWLRPGGIIHIEVPSSKYFIARLINFYYKICRTTYVSNLSPMHTPFHLYEFDLKSFEKLGEKLNYKIQKYEYHVCEISFIPKILKPLFHYFMKVTNTGMQLTVYLKK